MVKHVAAMRAADKCSISLLLGALLLLGGCNRMATPPAVQMVKDADARAANGDFLQAVSLYESALDGSAGSADIHYKMALLYDDKMGDALNAMHHFKRYLTLAPTGPRAEEVKNFMKRDELSLLTTLSGDSVVSRAEATRLKNENLNLRQQLEDRRLAEARMAAANKETRTRSERAKSSARSKRTSQR
jgi:tetratricopeptide (TPR) repeat protein